MLEGERLAGEAYDPMNDNWDTFTINLTSGKAIGDSYPPELPQ